VDFVFINYFRNVLVFLFILLLQLPNLTFVFITVRADCFVGDYTIGE